MDFDGFFGTMGFFAAPVVRAFPCLVNIISLRCVSLIWQPKVSGRKRSRLCLFYVELVRAKFNS